MKKKILFLLTTFLFFSQSFAENLEVKSNIPSGTFDTPIEVNLISNDKNAKIFYYTDGEGRMDHIKEFKNPIFLQENTQLDFYATGPNYQETLIQTTYYTFSYSNHITLAEKNGKIIVKNTSGDIQNIGYWKIETDDLDYMIPKNTYIDNGKEYTLDYSLKNAEKVSLFAPDNSLKQTYTYKKTPVSQTAPETSTPEKKEPIQNTPEEKIITETGVSDTQNTQVVPKEKPTTIENFSLGDHLKTSVIESKKEENSKTKNLYYILGMLVIVTLYNIGLFLKKNGTFTEIKTKINKIGKK